MKTHLNSGANHLFVSLLKSARPLSSIPPNSHACFSYIEDSYFIIPPICLPTNIFCIWSFRGQTSPKPHHYPSHLEIISSFSPYPTIPTTRSFSSLITTTSQPKPSLRWQSKYHTPYAQDLIADEIKFNNARSFPFLQCLRNPTSRLRPCRQCQLGPNYRKLGHGPLGSKIWIGPGADGATSPVQLSLTHWLNYLAEMNQSFGSSTKTAGLQPIFPTRFASPTKTLRRR